MGKEQAEALSETFGVVGDSTTVGSKAKGALSLRRNPGEDARYQKMDT